MNEPSKHEYTPEELRKWAQNERLISDHHQSESASMLYWAADKIQELKKENDRLRSQYGIPF